MGNEGQAILVRKVTGCVRAKRSFQKISNSPAYVPTEMRTAGGLLAIVKLFGVAGSISGPITTFTIANTESNIPCVPHHEDPYIDICRDVHVPWKDFLVLELLVHTRRSVH
jgi:hypothetical protein